MRLNDPLILLLTITQYFLKFVVFLFFLSKMVPWKPRFSQKGLVIPLAALAGAAADFFITILIMRATVFFPVFALLGAAVFLLLAVTLFDGNIYLRIFCVLLFTMLVWLIDFFCRNALQLAFPTVSLGLIHHISANISRPFVLLVCLYIAHITKKNPIDIKPPVGYWISVYIITMLEYFCGIFINDLLTFNNLLSPTALLMQVALLGMIIAGYAAFLRVCQNYQRTIRQTLTEQQLNMQKSHFIESQSTFENLRALQHEFKNHIFYMDFLLEKKDYKKLDEYFAGYRNKQEAFRDMESGNTIVNAVLNQKLRTAQQKNIKIVIDSASLPEKTSFEDMDLCAVVSNLLDNAIEACEGQSAPRIFVTMKMVKNHLHILVKNTIEEDVLKLNPALHTTKDNKAMHGLGLRIIRSISEKYNGILNFSVENSFFITALTLQEKEMEPHD